MEKKENKEKKETIVKVEKSNSENKVIAIALVSSLVGGILGGVCTYGILNKNGIRPNPGTNVDYKIESVESAEVAIAKNATPSIVGIQVKALQQGFMGMLQEKEGSGSGIVYSNDGYIITNYHVIEDAILDNQAKISVHFAGEKEPVDATVIGGDKVTDLAVIKVEKPNLKVAKMGKSKELKVGEKAVAIGNPLGLEFAGSVTSGIVSALDRKITTDGSTYNLIQTDAAINPGNSGGALLNSKGEVIGINTIKIGSTGVEGLGFAIPIDDAIPIVQELIKNKKIKRPYIGIACFEVSETEAKKYDLPQGVMVESVEKASPAHKAGLERGDIITEVDSNKIITMDELNKIKYKKQVGETLELKVYRNKKYENIKVVLEEEQ